MAYGVEVVCDNGRAVGTTGRIPRLVETYTFIGIGPWTVTPGYGFNADKKGHFCKFRNEYYKLSTHYVVYNGLSITVKNRNNMTATETSTTIVDVFVS